MQQNRPGSEGMGTIIAVLAIAALLVIGMLYIMQAPSEPPSSATSEGPAKTAPAAPAPAPKPSN